MVNRRLAFIVLLIIAILSVPVVWSGCKGNGPAPSGAAQASPASSAESKSAPASEKKVFPSPLAGSWYDADKNKLSAEIDGYLAKADQPRIEGVSALILPHAGYRFSGPTAAYGIKQIAGRKFSRVIILGPSHHEAMRDAASVPDATHYSTPLGETPIDTALVKELLKSPYFKTVPAANEPEHSVQIALPMLQKALGDFRFLPIVVGQLSPEAARVIAEVLLSVIDENTLVVASSDFTHYGPNFGFIPFRDDIPENLKKLDMGAYARIEAKDRSGFEKFMNDTHDTVCGRHPISVLLAMLPADAQVKLLHYDTSGAITGDYSNSVSYLSVSFTGKWSKSSKPEEKKTKAELSPEDRKRLLALARGTLKTYLETGKTPTPVELGIKITPGMKQIMGAFVTLKSQGMLRGCIGEIYPMRPVYEAVAAHAIDAAAHDPRFPPVRMPEFAGLKIEISALTPPEPVASYNDIVIGKHGVVIQKRGRSAVFLPQVAVEEHWGLEEMLGYLSQKAGLPSDAWKEGASFTVFEAIVFGEEGA